jgi:flagellar biosynthesis protein FlhB
MDETELDKSEQATPFKLKRAREKGTIARGIDLGFFTALTACIAYGWLNGYQTALSIGQSSAITFANVATASDSSGALFAQFGFLFSSILSPLLLFGATIFSVVLFFDFLQVGPVFSFQPLKPDFSRINPAQGLKRLFNMKMLIEALKSTLKLAIYGMIAWLVIRNALANNELAITDGTRLLFALARTGFSLLLFFALAAMVFAASDQILSRRQYSKKMRMSRRELKREYKDREGDNRLKQKRKEFHAEFAKMAKSLRGAREADVILTNPTHYAVALRYMPEKTDAPVIVSRGTGKIAERIKSIGFIYGVTIIQDPPLARALFRDGKLEEEIPELLFQSVADIYRTRNLVRRKFA